MSTKKAAKKKPKKQPGGVPDEMNKWTWTSPDHVWNGLTHNDSSFSFTCDSHEQPTVTVGTLGGKRMWVVNVGGKKSYLDPACVKSVSYSGHATATASGELSFAR